MLFNSIDFAIFLPTIFILYCFLLGKNLRLQNSLIVLASYIFYGWWDWRFLSLIFFSTIVDFFVGHSLSNEENKVKRKALLLVSIVVNLGLLGFFKYYNFFLDSFIQAFTFLGIHITGNSLNVILPVGISFYTFQTLSYSFDIYKRKLEPTKDFIAFSAFVSFFPQLVAGPIERATNLLPQFYKKRKFDYSLAVDGLRQMLWGFFKKIVIADSCAEYANLIFDNSSNYSGTSLALGALFFSFQIYGDFSGYSDIAIGTSRLFGFDLMRNFNFPYFSRDIAEFWRRWHISLTTWFRDYFYIPLGGSHCGRLKMIRNTFAVFIVSGFWHGANWTFIAWGALNAIYYLPLILANKNRKNIEIVSFGKSIPTFKELLSMILTFGLTLIAWVFFRARSVEHAFDFLKNTAIGLLHKTSYVQTADLLHGVIGLTLPLLLMFFIVIEWNGRTGQYAIQHFGINWRRPYRYAFYYALIIAMFYFGGKEQQFIYFQF